MSLMEKELAAHNKPNLQVSRMIVHTVILTSYSSQGHNKCLYDEQIQVKLLSSNFQYDDQGPVFSKKLGSQLNELWTTEASISMSFHSLSSTIFR